MPIIDTNELPAGEPRPGWHDRYFHSELMSFAYYEVDEGASIHEHAHLEEEVWHVIEGILRFTLDGEDHVLGPGTAAVVPSNVPHAVHAATNARVIIANHPVRGRIQRHR
jgi:unsaturated pyranuronate lyase